MQLRHPCIYTRRVAVPRVEGGDSYAGTLLKTNENEREGVVQWGAGARGVRRWELVGGSLWVGACGWELVPTPAQPSPGNPRTPDTAQTPTRHNEAALRSCELPKRRFILRGKPRRF